MLCLVLAESVFVVHYQPLVHVILKQFYSRVGSFPEKMIALIENIVSRTHWICSGSCLLCSTQCKDAWIGCKYIDSLSSQRTDSWVVVIHWMLSLSETDGDYSLTGSGTRITSFSR